MEWLSHNWVWLALGIGFIFFTRRGGLGHCGMSHQSHEHGKADAPGVAAATDIANAGADTTDTRHAATHRRHGCC